MNMIKIGVVTALVLQSSVAFAGLPSNLTRTSANTYIAGIEKELQACSISPEEAGECYDVARNQYDQLLKVIRSKYGAKVNQNLWQSINLKFKKQGDACRSDFLLSGDTQFFLPYLDCVTNNLHSLAVTAVELHLK